MSASELYWRSALELADLIRARAVSPVEVTEAILARIAALNPRLNAFCLVADEQARAQAREAEIAVSKGEPLGPLHGVPVSIKDVVFTRGLTTTGGSRLFQDFEPAEDAVSVARLKEAGAVILGKTATPEFGHKAITESPLFGVTRNPWNPDLTPGGSSGGAAAAVAAGLGPLAVGTDGGGSVRVPAAFCNLVGFKPSWGRIPATGGFAGWDHLGVSGPLTRTVRDAALMLDVMVGPDDRDRHSLPREPGSALDACEERVKGLHVAWAPDLGYATVEPAVLAPCQAAAAELEALGCHVEVVNPGWEDPEAVFSTLVGAQLAWAWGDRLETEEARLDPTLVRFLRKGLAVTAREYLEAQARATAWWLEVRAFLERFDLLLTPTTAVPPFPAPGRPPREIAGRAVSVLGWMPFTYPFNLTGQPAASVPAGFTGDDRPVGLQIVGRRHADRTVLAAAAALEAARPWSDRRPMP